MNVDIVTGYLGAGKTSYINRLLGGTDRSSDEAKKTATSNLGQRLW